MFILQAAEWRKGEGQRCDSPWSELPLRNFVSSPTLQLLPVISREDGKYGFLNRICQKSLIIWGCIYTICISCPGWSYAGSCFPQRWADQCGFETQSASYSLDVLGQVRELLSQGTSLRLNFIIYQMEIIIEPTL